MMGDPLTKVLLHNTNILIRRLGRYIAEGAYEELILDNPVQLGVQMVSYEPFTILDNSLPIMTNAINEPRTSLVNRLVPQDYRPVGTIVPAV